MTAFQGLKTVVLLGALAGLSACGQADKTAEKADAAPAEAPQAAASEAAPVAGGAPTIDQLATCAAGVSDVALSTPA